MIRTGIVKSCHYRERFMAPAARLAGKVSRKGAKPQSAAAFLPDFFASFVGLSEALKLSLAGTVSTRSWGHLAVVLVCSVIAFFGATCALRRAQ